ncbi:Aste57867_24772 [Aphanomyces stellatus]|uniref:Aste57867_24772 protein n=1 Tax=Aphanomyces stellatus TaxID=120398 RepID=A0A485LRZ4_9STRA|nr:hypothetical protein As57867_024694 [Aphanomyces stellatus]VFU01408.1 Aste57867_24772 [Aphanomyces stellatus]
MTGTHAFISTWLNQRLILGANISSFHSTRTPTINCDGMFDQATGPPKQLPTLALVQHSQLNTIEAAMAGLRAPDGCMTPWIFTPY